MTAPVTMIVERWRPNLDAAVDALRGRAQIDPADFALHPGIHADLMCDARAVLDASGATAEIKRLRAVLARAHGTIRALRDENEHMRQINTAMLLGPLFDGTAGL